MNVNISSKLSVVTRKGDREVALGGPKGDPGVSDLAPWVLYSVEIPKLCTDDPKNTSVYSLFNDSVPRCERIGFAFGYSIISQQSELVTEQKPNRT